MENPSVRNLLHLGLCFTRWLGRLPWPCTPALIAASALALRAGPAALWLALWSLADWLLLESLPRLGLSYGTVQPSHLALLAVRWLVAGLGVWLGPLRVLTWAAQPLLWGLAVYATAVEPFCLGVTELRLSDERASPGARPLSILQIGDIHVERLTRRERRLLELVERLEADLILLTGDYLSLSYVGEARALADVRELLGRLKARHGIYAVRGTPQVDPQGVMDTLFQGLPIVVLEGARAELEVDGHRLRIVGVGCDRDFALEVPALRAALAGAEDGYFTILLYHMPDLLAPASDLGVDLYLAGHTHGGQLRLPLIGAIITGSRFGKRYEMGWYRRGRTRLYVARGVGLEGMGAPRARFLCPPEVVHIRLAGGENGKRGDTEGTEGTEGSY